MTLTTLERYCEWLRDQVLKADREITPETWRTNFDFVRTFRNSPICLCIAASIGTEAFLERKVMKVKFEELFAKAQVGNEAIVEFDKDELRYEGWRQLYDKLCEFAQNPLLLPTEALQ
jgi:hypothetical protein